MEGRLIEQFGDYSIFREAVTKSYWACKHIGWHWKTEVVDFLKCFDTVEECEEYLVEIA